MNPPIRLLVHGASGRMGRAVLRLAAEDPRFDVVAAVSRSGAPVEGCAAPALAGDALARSPAFDVVIDFSLPAALPPLLDLCVARGAALVSGTTGLDPDLRGRLDQAARSIPVAWASNFSLGVVVLEDLLRRAAGALAWPVEITETHHVHKLDAPSGTAITLAAAAASAQGRTPPIESIREGEVVGTHRVRLLGTGEVLELGHVASDRDIFARGALEAAARLRGRKPGSWRLADLLFEDKNVVQPAD
jgi:4-hydroxy-tetrahydrodipicolinate reductase